MTCEKNTHYVRFAGGIDFHGEDETKAVQRAVKDAISHSNMVGLREFLKIKSLENLDKTLLHRRNSGNPAPYKN